MRTLLRGGSVVDGTGGPPATVDVWLEEDRIAAVGTAAGAADLTSDYGRITIQSGKLAA
jgi:N-acyl-D-amino-acid deacylase